MLTEVERRRLLEVARTAVAAHLAGQPAPSLGGLEGALLAPAAAFVTLRRGDQLRGCIGSMTDTRPLVETVAGCAVASATSDPRFPPIESHELSDMAFEISVLGALEPITGPHEIETGRHGLVVEQGRDQGLLLPQVAEEWGWDAEAFLGQTCQKAGLAPDAWRTGARVFRFEAEVFGE